jgi:indole-3-glycerol phosphate synthase
MAALVEVHNEAELERVLPMKPRLLGINNRNLHDFSVDITNCLRLRSKIPAGITLIAESGIHTPFDMAALKGASMDAALIGEAIVKTPVVEEKITELLSFVRPTFIPITTNQKQEAAAV